MKSQKHFLETLMPLQPTLQVVAERLLGNAEEAEDAVQETYLRLWERRRKLVRHLNPEGYAMQTLKNLCVSLLRRRRPSVTLESIEIADDEQARQEALLTEERAARLDALMQRLPEVQRRAIQMKYIDGRSHEEMQRELGMSSANVYTTLSRAVANLKLMIHHGR